MMFKSMKESLPSVQVASTKSPYLLSFMNQVFQAMDEDLQFKAAMEESIKVTQRLAFFVFKSLPVRCMFNNTLPPRCMFIYTLPSCKVHTSLPAGSAEDAAASSYDEDLQKTIEMSLRVGGSQLVKAYPDFGILQMIKKNGLAAGVLKIETYQF